MKTLQRKARPGKRTRFGLELESSAKEILAHVKGDKTLPVRRIVLPDEVDVKHIRERVRMSQSEFAQAFCINPRTLQEWDITLLLLSVPHPYRQGCWLGGAPGSSPA